ncbi:MAG: hypothetical protein QW366_02925 [Sulfolobales archaeon]
MQRDIIYKSENIRVHPVRGDFVTIGYLGEAGARVPLAGHVIIISRLSGERGSTSLGM